MYPVSQWTGLVHNTYMHTSLDFSVSYKQGINNYAMLKLNREKGKD